MKICLSNVIVVDLSRVLAGPLTAQMLGDLGAEVIKVERPGTGDDSRMFGPPFLKDAEGKDTSESPMFMSANRNKKSITIDFSKKEGCDVLLALIAKADVLVENYKVGDLSRYGLDYVTLSKRFPALIYCSVTGYGQTGPYAARPGYDAVFQAESGLMSVTGLSDDLPGGGPMKVGPSIADVVAGLYASNAILASLYRRDARNGNGEHIDIALLESMVAGLGHFATQYLCTGLTPQRRGSQGNGGVPGQSFDCKDGAIMMTAGNQGQYKRFCLALGRPDLIDDPRFHTNTERVRNRSLVSDTFAAETAKWKVDDLLQALDAAVVPAGRINTLSQMFADPHVIERAVVQSLEHPLSDDVRLVRNPILLKQAVSCPDLPPPLLGQHENEILLDWLKIDPDKVRRLRSEGVL